MIKAVIIDDEQKSIDVLSGLINRFCHDIEITGTAGNANDAIALIKKNKPDVVFLDIEISEQNAFDILDAFTLPVFEVVFVTAHKHYAHKAFQYDAADYILKPISIEDLKATVNKIKRRIAFKNNPGETNPAEKKQFDDSRRIAVKTDAGFYFEDVASIVYLQSKGSYTLMSLINKKKITISKNLKKFEELLPQLSFFRVHHSYIINLGCIKKYHTARGGYVEMTTGELIEISTRRKKDFLDRFTS